MLPKNFSTETSDEDKSHSSHKSVLKDKYGTIQKAEEEEDKTVNGDALRIKGGIEIGADGYYHGNILSEKIEGINTTMPSTQAQKNENSSSIPADQKLMKIRMMPVKCLSESEDK